MAVSNPQPSPRPKLKPVPEAAVAAVGDTLREQGLSAPAVGGGTTFLQAKTANEVLRRHEQHLEWVDVVAAPAAWAGLLALARRRAAALDLPTVEAWVTQSQQHLLQALAAQDVALRSLGIRVPANAHAPGPDVDRQRGRWLLMAGDTDFR